MSRQINNILIRNLSEKDQEALSAVMAETGCGQASKAVMRAVYSFLRSQALIQQQSGRIKELEAENLILHQNAVLITTAVKRLDGVLLSKRE